MVDMTAITGLATSIRAAVEITKAMKDIHDANIIQTKTFELTREILAAQSYAMEAVAAQSALLDRVRELEAEKAKLEAWNTEKSRYKLADVGSGIMAYALKEGMENGEPPHQLCASCYHAGFKSILMQATWSPGRCDVLVCHDCGWHAYLSGQAQPEHKDLKPKPYRGK